jgi:hypothetical protein
LRRAKARPAFEDDSLRHFLLKKVAKGSLGLMPFHLPEPRSEQEPILLKQNKKAGCGVSQSAFLAPLPVGRSAIGSRAGRDDPCLGSAIFKIS